MEKININDFKAVEYGGGFAFSSEDIVLSGKFLTDANKKIIQMDADATRDGAGIGHANAWLAGNEGIRYNVSGASEADFNLLFNVTKAALAAIEGELAE